MCEECVQDPLRGLLSKFEAEGMDVLGEFVSLDAVIDDGLSYDGNNS